MALTFLFSIFFTIAGVLAVDLLLNFMSTPEDVFREASTYLTIYIGGISGLLVYNMGSGILRAVGDTTRPLYFLVLTSLVNIVLDLFFVIKLKMGIAGVAFATIIAQFISAILIMMLLCRSKDIYRFTWRDLRIDPEITKQIFVVALPAGIQSVITAFSNVFVQSYINFFGSSAMAGWSCFNKLDQFIMLPMQSMAMASTTFVSQNFGAQKEKRADRGTLVSILLTFGVTSVIVILLYIFAASAVRLFTPDESVIRYGVLFIYANTGFFLCNCVNHVLAGALRGRGDARGPMVIMITCFVLVRQTYLYLVTHYVANTPLTVCLAYPVGWATCCIAEVVYFFCQRKKRQEMLRTRETE